MLPQHNQAMKNILRIMVLLILLFIVKIPLSAQDDRHQYDSIMGLVKDRSLPLLERYYMTGEIEHLSAKHKIGILTQLLPETRQFSDKALVSRLYAMISLAYTSRSEFEPAKVYIDSAFIYKDRFDDDIISGLIYYAKGVFYLRRNMPGNAYGNYCKAVEYLSRKDPKPSILMDVYQDLSVIYGLKYDEKGLKQLSEWIGHVPQGFPANQILKNTVDARYYNTMYRQTGQPVYLDSATIRNQEVFDIYHMAKQPSDLCSQVADNYLLQSYVYYLKQRNDSARQCLDNALKLISQDNWLANVSSKLISGYLGLAGKRYAEAEKALLDGIGELKKLSDEQKADYYHVLIPYYSTLSQVYEKQGIYDKALEAERESLRYEQLLYDSNNNELIQSLKTRYDLDMKQRLVDQLTEINESNKRNRYLYLGVGGLLICILILIIMRYRARQKISLSNLHVAQLKKEEAEQAYQLLFSESKLKQINSYLEGLEAERLRLSKELHDNISNGLVSVDMMLSLSKGEDTSLISDMIRDIHRQVRSISHELIPPVFQHASLSEILFDFVHQQNLLNKSRVSLSLRPQDRWDSLPENLSFEIYRIIQEAVGNAMKYAQAEEVRIELWSANGNIRLRVWDNGQGFDTAAKHKGIGLLIIRERTESIHGRLSIVSAHDEGTEIRIDIPLS